MTVKIHEQAILEEIQEEEVSSFLHGVIGVRLSTYLNVFVDEHNAGYVTGPDTDYAIPEIGTRRPDVAFVSLAKMPEPIDDIIPFAPDLAAEIISRTDDWSAVAAKANLYFQADTRLVWAIDPYTKSVFVFRKNVKLQLLSQDEELDGLDVLPGFKLRVSLLFQRQARKS